MTLPPFSSLLMPLCYSISLLADFNVLLGCLLRFFLKGMQHADYFLKLRHIKHTVRPSSTDTNLLDSRTNGGHRPKIRRILSTLNCPQFETGFPFGL